MSKKKRSCYSIKNELLKKSQESALAAIQIFNNPIITFKAESFIVLMNIAWTYLIHAYYRKENIDYRYYKNIGKRKKYDKTKHGAYKHWELESCLGDKKCPLEQAVKDNLKFLIGIRHEIEHQMTNKIDDLISAKFQACCINYNNVIRKLFKNDFAIEKNLPLALQFSTFTEHQIDSLKDKTELPKNVIDFVANFENTISTKTDPAYSYKVIYLRDSVNRENQADNAIRFIDEESTEGQEIHNVLIKVKHYKKLTQSGIVSMVQSQGYKNFDKQDHYDFWKTKWTNARERNIKATK